MDFDTNAIAFDIGLIRTRRVLTDLSGQEVYCGFFPILARRALPIALALLFITPLSAWSEANSVATNLVAYKIVKTQDGLERRDPGDSVIPGDILEYQATYKNSGKASVQNLVGQLPIPDGMTYIADTGDPKPLYASVDGLKFEIVPLTKIVKRSDGKEERVLVSYTEYRVLQWELGGLAKGESKTVRARARLNTREDENVKEEQLR